MKYENLRQIVEQLEKCEYQTKDGLHKLEMNKAFITLKEFAKCERCSEAVTNIFLCDNCYEAVANSVGSSN